MNKAELVSAVAEKAEVSKTVAAKTIDALLETITGELANGGTVQFVGFGTFVTRKREARTGRNPKNGEPLEIAASTTPVFKPGTSLKDAVNNG
jgi:DNA-binding protein HU-beta